MKYFSQSMSAVMIATAVLLSSQAWADDATHRISVTGIGEVSAAPDKATISVSIEARAKRMKDAREQVSSVVGRALAVTDALEIDRKYVNTSASTIRPEYRYHDGKRSFEGYYVSRQVLIDLRDLDNIGPLTEKLLDAGINNVSPPNLGSTKAADLKREALKRAIADAKLNAEIIADALGQKLGKALQVNAHSNHHRPVPQPMMMKAAFAEADSAAPANGYETGEIRFSANVNASFAIE